MTDILSENAGGPTKRRWFKSPKIVRRFGDDKRGATAVEFGMLAAPFFMLFMAIIETSLLFFAGEMLESAVDEVGRKVRTGQLDNTMSEAEFKTEVCNAAAILFDCDGINVDLQVVATFDDLGDFPKPVDGAVDPSTYNFTAPNAEQIVMITATYEWPTFSNYMARLMTELDSGNALLNAVAVFRTEPYD